MTEARKPVTLLDLVEVANVSLELWAVIGPLVANGLREHKINFTLDEVEAARLTALLEVESLDDIIAAKGRQA